MRMDTSTGMTAAEWINRAAAEEITSVLKLYGEEKFSSRIAAAICERRTKEPFYHNQGFSRFDCVGGTEK